MTDKKDDAGKSNPATPGGFTQSASGPGAKPSDTKPSEMKPSEAKPGDPKRPQAVVEGKAVEISSTTIHPDSSKADAAKPSMGPGAPGIGSTVPPASKYDALKSGTKQPADAKPSDTKPTTPPKAAATPPARSSGSGFGSMFSHLIAGVLGGAAAWYGISTIGPELGKQYGIEMPAPHATEIRAIQDDLARLKKVAAPPSLGAAAAGPDLSAKLAAAEAEIKKLQDTAKSVAALDAGQAKVAADVKALAEAQARQADADARVAKLEQRLKIMSEATGADTGKLPQLAAVTGRLVDLEATMTNQLSALRKTVSQELESRLALTDENSNAAKSGTGRIDRELSAVKSETSAMVGRLDTIKAESDRLASGLAAMREDTNTLKSAVETIRAEVDTKFKAAVKPADVASAIAPVAGKLGSIEQNLASVVKSEEDRKSNAERIVLSLELNNLKRVIDRGQKYNAELAEVAKMAGGKIDLSALDRHKDKGLPSLADLTREFPSVANAMLDSEAAPAADGSMLDRVMASAKSVVRVRKLDHPATDKSLEAVIGRMELALRDGRLADAAAESRTLSPKAAAAGQAFLVKLESRAAVDTAIASIEKYLKSSIAGKATN
ncbi:MAG: hypothetical protein K2Y05_02790 [Hyphomicrobiaceae bacterium]|nr:hypothetical protein [Hyphomicrobiaceae bacterium]